MQLQGLRATLPSLVDPLLRRDDSKARMFANAKKSAVKSRSNLNAFRTAWTSQQMQEILLRSKESYEKDRDLGKAKEVAKDGWATDD